MNAFLLSFGVILLAELGDKSQLMAMAFAARYRASMVLVAISVATLVVHAGSVLLGSAFALALPTGPIQIVAGLAFFWFAWWTMRGDALGQDDEDRAARSGRWALVTIGTAFFLAELGDKTMLATITLATNQEPIGTWLGSTMGMVAADAIAIAIGALMGARLPERAIKYASSAASRRLLKSTSTCSLRSRKCSTMTQRSPHSSRPATHRMSCASWIPERCHEASRRPVRDDGLVERARGRVGPRRRLPA